MATSDREVCGTCGKYLRPSHWCNPADAERLDAWRDPVQRRELKRFDICMRLASDVDAFDALMRGENVHPSRLDREQLARLRAEGLWHG